MEQDTLDQSASSADAPNETKVFEHARTLLQELRGLSHDHFQLAALEMQQAGLSFVAMITAGIVVTLFLNGAWLGFLAFGVLRLMEHGVIASDAILLAVAFNLMLVLFLLAVIRRKSRDLKLPAILRSLKPAQTRQI